PRTTLALGGWALGISGLTLNTYSVLSATFRDVLPNGGHVSTVAQVVAAAALLVALALTGLYAFRVYFVVATGEPVRRRGFDVSRLREVDARLRATAFLALAGAGAATLVGIPGVGLTFSRFIFYGARQQDLGLDLLALALAAALAVGGALGARELFGAGRRQPVAEGTDLARLGLALADPTPAERVAGALPGGFVAAADTLDRLEVELLGPIPAAMGESVGTISEALTRLRAVRIGLSTTAALAVIAIILAASVLAATGNFPVTIQ
ncbi:MAG TPA: hypothetical protein VLO10_02595, partial [Candidatus Deferrimicrobium sp.]|nr:hypothetical protein [Candidatus Deferrimicrobium sp.]